MLFRNVGKALGIIPPSIIRNESGSARKPETNLLQERITVRIHRCRRIKLSIMKNKHFSLIFPFGKM